MEMKDVRNNVHRSGFDLSRRNCFTAKVGEILPVMCEEVLPGDKWSIDIRQFMRTAPVQTASFGRVRQYYDFYFVPYSLLWDKFDAWVMQTKNAYHSKSLTTPADEFSSQPYVLFSQMWAYVYGMKSGGRKLYNDSPDALYSEEGSNLSFYQTSKLLAYLGYPINASASPTNTEVAVNVFPLLAYQKIYQDYFRFSQWEDAAPWTYNLDYVLGENQLELSLVSLSTGNFDVNNPTMFTLRYCNYDKDYFNGLLPSPQYGDTAIAGPIGGIPSASNPSNLNFSLPVNQDSSGIFGANLIYNAGAGNQIQGVSASSSSTVNSYLANAYFSDSSGSSGLSVLLLRQAECLQKWKEITLSGSPDYREQLQKHWNVNVSTDNSYLCRYLGGMASDIDISEVVNTNLDAEGSQADIHGKGVAAGSGHIDFESHQYGIIMCVYHAKPIIEWESSTIMPRMFMKTKATDYAIPEFDNIGMQSVLFGEFLGFNSDHYADPVGYAPRYVEYKTSFDRVNGAFETSLAPWVIPHNLQGDVDTSQLTYKAFKCSATVLDNMFGINASDIVETDQFYNTAYLKVNVVRNLSRNGLPY